MRNLILLFTFCLFSTFILTSSTVPVTPKGTKIERHKTAKIYKKADKHKLKNAKHLEHHKISKKAKGKDPESLYNLSLVMMILGYVFFVFAFPLSIIFFIIGISASNRALNRTQDQQKIKELNGLKIAQIIGLAVILAVIIIVGLLIATGIISIF